MHIKTAFSAVTCCQTAPICRSGGGWLFGAFLMALLVSGCTADMPVKDSTAAAIATPAPSPVADPAALTEPLTSSEPQAAAVTPKVTRPKLDIRVVMVHQLLEQAQWALAEDRLTTPKSDNAYDKFRAVLLIDPTNLEAKAGEEAVKQRYATLARQAIERERLLLAGQYLEAGKETFPYDKLWSTVQAELTAKRNALALRDPPKPVDVGSVKRLQLSGYHLRAKSESVKNLLQKVVARLERTDESVMIYARSDAEGRWIYQTMKEYAPHYLIRGDIRVSERPALEFLAPLDW